MIETKTAIVTGASRGIGLEIVRDLIARGWNVGMLARNAAVLQSAAAEFPAGSVLPLACDVGDAAQVAAAVAQITRDLGAVTALVNNAGVIDPMGRITDVDPADWMELQRINIGGPMLLARAVIPGMIAAGGGTIVSLSSGAASGAVAGWSAYCTSKAALRMLSMALDVDHSADGIRVHDFIPGLVATDMLKGSADKFDNAITRKGDDEKITPDLPARCIGWLIDQGKGRVEGVVQSIRDPELRAMAGLPERASW